MFCILLFIVVLKLKVTHEPTSNLEEVEKEIVAKLNQLQDTTVPKSEEVWRFLSQLKRANIEIVSSRQDKGVVMWCWCHSQPALKKLDDISMSDTKQPNILNGLFALLLSGKTAPTISSVYLENPEKEVGKIIQGLHLRPQSYIRDTKISISAYSALLSAHKRQLRNVIIAGSILFL